MYSPASHEHMLLSKLYSVHSNTYYNYHWTKKNKQYKLGLSWATLEKEQQIFKIGVGVV